MLSGFENRALNHPIMGPKFSPIPNAKKYVFFPIQQKKSQFDPPLHLYFIYIFTISRNNRIQSQLLLSLPFLISIHYSNLIIGINLAMETSYIRTMSNFPILVKTPLIFPIPWALAPFPKRGVRLECYFCCFQTGVVARSSHCARSVKVREK